MNRSLFDWRFSNVLEIAAYLMLLVYFAGYGCNGDESSSEQRIANFTKVLDGLLVDYDKRLRPNFGGDPEMITVTIHIVAISDITETGMDFKVEFFFRQYWLDKRLAFPGSVSDVTIGIDLLSQIWRPDTFFRNGKETSFHEATTHNTFLRITPNGNIFVSQRFTVKAACPMILRLFPMDEQQCRLEIVSYGYTDADILYKWAEDKPLSQEDDVRLPQFDLAATDVDKFVASGSTGNYPGLQLKFVFRRNIGYYVMQVYLPAIVIVIISALGFWFPPDLIGDRIALCVAAVLTMTVLMTTTNSTLPKISYVKAIDVYLITSFLLIFLSLIEGSLAAFIIMTTRRSGKESEPPKSAEESGQQSEPASSDIDTSQQRRSRKRRRHKKSERFLVPPIAYPKGDNKWSKFLAFYEAASLDRACRIFFIVFFVAFNIVYWSVYLNLNKSF